ncbi:hypothetical protein H3C66_01395 [Patescibacteria group bacterium]|nr:hypothetical protein [Patescibacteria group bacterium]
MVTSSLEIIGARCAGLHQFEKQVWPEKKRSNSIYASLAELELLWRTSADKPFFEDVLTRWNAHVEKIAAVRDLLVPPELRTINPIADINASRSAKNELLTMLKVPLEAADKISLVEDYPFCFVFRYNGMPEAFAKLFGTEYKLHWDLGGFYFHVSVVEVDEWLRNSVIWTFQRQWPMSPKNRPGQAYIDQYEAGVKRHEVRHFLDFFYNNWPEIADPARYLEWRILLELGATLAELDMGASPYALTGLILSRVPEKLMVPLKADQQAYDTTQAQVRQILTPILNKNVDLLNYWSIAPAQSMSLPIMEQLVSSNPSTEL